MTIFVQNKKRKFTIFVILQITLLSHFNCLQITLRSKVCFEIVKPFKENLKIHYDRDYEGDGVDNLNFGKVVFINNLPTPLLQLCPSPTVPQYRVR